MPYILAISVGPVQDFIAAARKTRDLWAGSEMLSEMSRAVAQHLADKGCSLIFPSPDSLPKSERGITNKLLAIVREGDPDTISADARKVAEKFLTDQLKDVLKHLHEDLHAKCTEQVKRFLEFYAAWYPLGDNFGTALRDADRLLAARKALRDFLPTVSEENVPKSSLDGGLDAVIRVVAEKAKRRPGDLSPQEGLKLGIKSGELLDAVSLIKRAGKLKSFVSTARVAADPFIRRFQNDQVLQDLLQDANRIWQLDSDLCREFAGINHYECFPYDTQLFFFDAQEDKDESDDAKKLAKQFYQTVQQARKDAGLPELLPYYAIIAADGDGMGKHISKIAGSSTDENGLVEFSSKLSAFSDEVRTIVEDHSGALVYGGGDDVLALLPLDTALACADALRKKFTGKLPEATISVGVAIAHVKAGLQNAIGWARKAEQAAKAHPGKNALAVHLHTHSAGDDYVESVRSWNDDPVNNWWDEWIGWIREGEISNQTAYHLRNLEREFKQHHGPPDVLELEMRRIIGKKKNAADQPVGETIQKAIAETSKQPAQFRSSLFDTTINELIISRRLAQAAEVAPPSAATTPTKGGATS